MPREPRQVTYRCEWCREDRTELRMPGPLPRYCSDACRHEAQNALAAGRMHRKRARDAGKDPEFEPRRPRGRPPGRPKGS